MIGLFLITHGSLGESLVQCACHVLNKRPQQIVQLGVSGQDDPLDALPLARDMMKLVDSGRACCCSPTSSGRRRANVALKLLQPGRVEGVSGVNLPMLLRALTYRERTWRRW
jgi:PTS system mannose-specific IIA component